MLSQDELDVIRELTEEFLGRMGLSLKASVFSRSEEVQINVSGNDRAYLITDNGETLLSLQYILSRIIRQKIPSTTGLRTLVDSDGYMFRHEQDLRRLASRTIQRVRKESRGIKLPPMNPFDRRIIHTEVARSDDLATVSEGDGFFKQIVVQLKF